jgi:spore maturation protein CgeB
MHIGLIGPYRPDLSVDNIGDALVRNGHLVSFLGSTQVALGGRVTSRAAALVLSARPDLEARYHERLVRAALRCECDAVITVEGGLAPEAVAALRQARVPVALWFPDHVANLGRQRMLAAPYSALFFKEPLLVKRLRDTLALPVWYLPQGCNPHWHRPIGEAGDEPVIAVVGNSYLSRLVLLRRLHEAGIPLRIYGAATPRWARSDLPPELLPHRPVFREAKSRVFRTAAGVLNNIHPAEMHGVNLRLFEATAAGAAVLCERRATLGELFDLDREVVPFTDFGELIERARELLGDADRTREIGDAASKRAHAEHSIDQRLPPILEKLA